MQITDDERRQAMVLARHIMGHEDTTAQETLLAAALLEARADATAADTRALAGEEAERLRAEIATLKSERWNAFDSSPSAAAERRTSDARVARIRSEFLAGATDEAQRAATRQALDIIDDPLGLGVSPAVLDLARAYLAAVEALRDDRLALAELRAGIVELAAKNGVAL